MSRTITTLLIITALAVPALTGCSSKAPAKAELSLMERYHSGMPLIEDSAAELTSDQEEARAHLARGVHFAKQDRLELAFEQYTRASTLDPTLSEARYRRGLIMMRNGLNDAALAEFSAVSEQFPDFAPAYEAAGLVYFNNALYSEAEEQLAHALTLDPSLVKAQMHIGVIRNYAKDYPGALKAFSAALALAPNDGSIHNNIGMTHSMMGNDEAAVKSFNTALRLGAPTAKAYNNMGLALARLNRWAEALEAFRCAEGEAAAYNNIGYLYFLDGMYPQAVAAFERAIQLEPRFYLRASENLKRARLALSFADDRSAAPAHANGQASIPGLTRPGPVTPGPLMPAGGAPGPALIPAPATGTHSMTVMPIAPARRATGDRGTSPQSQAPATSGHFSGKTGSGPATSVKRTAGLVPASATGRAARHATPATVTATRRASAVAPVAFTPTPLTMNRPPLASGVLQAAAPKTAASPADLAGYDPGPLPERPVYSLHVSSWRTAEHAVQHADRLKARGFEPAILHVELPGKGQWYRVTMGMYDSLDEARTALEERSGDKRLSGLRIIRSQRFLAPRG